jgi:hypothetical protein
MSCEFPDAESEAFLLGDNRDVQMCGGGHARLCACCGVHGVLCCSSQRGLREKEEDVAVIGGPLLGVRWDVFCVCV